MTRLTSPGVPPSARLATRWGQERRLEFIDFRLRWEGQLNRSDIIAFFGISVPQASLDIASYLELAPGNLAYDRREKVYLAQDGFSPVFPGTNPSSYLNQLLATATGVLAPDASFVGWRPPVATVPAPGRSLNAGTLARLLHAVRTSTSLRVRYQSVSKPEPQWRELSPHAFGYDGFRWHVRAYCHSRGRHLDFVIARMLEVQLGRETAPVPSFDEDWSTEVELILVPNPKLSAAARSAVELDYGMEQGQSKLLCRKALLFYVLKHLGLDLSGAALPEATQVVLANRQELEELTRESQPR